MNSLRALRRRRRWKQDTLARKVGVDHSTISAWETGKSRPPVEQQHRLAAAFGVPRDSLGFDDDTSGPAVAAPLEVPGQVAPELVDYFAGQLQGHYVADMLLGPRHLIPTVFAQCRLIEQLTAVARGTLRQRFLEIATAYTAFLGWLYQDAGQIQDSGYWRDQTLDLAHRSSDLQLVSYALTNKAMLRTDAGDGLAVVELTAAATPHRRELAAKPLILAMQQQAHGYALLGERSAVDRLLDESAQLVDRVDDIYPWGNACRRTTGYLQIQRATCYGRLGLAAESARLWDGVFAQTPPRSGRDLGVYLARQARAYAASGEPEQATAVAARVVDLLAETGSARMRRELRDVDNQMTPWRGQPVGQDFAEILRPALLDHDPKEGSTRT